MANSKRNRGSRPGRPTPRPDSSGREKLPRTKPPPLARRDRLRRSALALAVAAVTFLVFSPALQNAFVNWDDLDIIQKNQHYRGLDPARLRWMFTATHGGHYEPLTWMSLAVDYLWGRAIFGDGLDPRAYHITSCLLHAASAALVYLLALRLLAAAIRVDAAHPPWLLHAAAVLAAGLFALHPLRVESVVWATERRDVLSSFLLLLTLLVYLRAIAAPAQRWHWLALATAIYALSLLSRALGVVLPAILLLIDWYPLRRFEHPAAANARSNALRVVLEKLPFLPLAVIAAILAVHAQASVGAAWGLERHGLLARLVQACYSLTFYAGKTLAPLNLSPIYEVYLPLNLLAPRYVIGVGLVLAALVTLVWLAVRGRGRPVIVAAACYALLILPVSGLVQSGKQEVADRYSYLPGAVLAIFLAGSALRVWSTTRTPTPVARGLAVAAVAAVGTCAVLTWYECGLWRDSLTLWAHAIRAEPGSAIAQNFYGSALLDQRHYDEAMVQFRRAIELAPAYSPAHMNIWRVLEETGRKDELLTIVRRTLALYPDSAEAHYELARNLAERGEEDAALEEYRAAVKLNPQHSFAHTNLAFMLRQRGQFDEALEHYRAATAANGDNLIAWLGWADLLHSLGREPEALDALRAALQVAPADPRARELWRAWTNTAPPP